MLISSELHVTVRPQPEPIYNQKKMPNMRSNEALSMALEICKAKLPVII